MPALKNIVLADGATTPVNHTFAPSSQGGMKAVFNDRSNGIVSAWGRLDIEVTEPKSPGAAHRVKIGFNIPETGIVDGMTVVDRNNSASLVLNFSPKSTDSDRKNLRAFVRNLLLDADVVKVIDNLEPFY